MGGITEVVYAVQWGEDGPIKIGACKSMATRMAQLQNASPHPLCVLLEVPGEITEERSLQAFLKGDHMIGEWFHQTPTVLEAIRNFAEGWRPPRASFHPGAFPSWGRKNGNCGGTSGQKVHWGIVP